MPSSLRFRSPYRGSKDALSPRTPKSPSGAYTGDPVSPVENSTSKRLLLKILFGVLTITALLSLALFSYRHILIPQFPIREIQAVFADQYAFQLQGARGDRAWLSMFPKGDGRVFVRHPRKYGLPASAGTVDGDGHAVPGTEIFDVAVIKQLDCLAFLRQVLIDYDLETHPHAHEKSRAFHCLDHVRQALLCAADTTLEPTRNGGVSTHSQPRHYIGQQNVVDEPHSGLEGALHTCKNWTVVKTWIEVNRAY